MENLQVSSSLWWNNLLQFWACRQCPDIFANLFNRYLSYAKCVKFGNQTDKSLSYHGNTNNAIRTQDYTYTRRVLSLSILYSLYTTWHFHPTATRDDSFKHRFLSSFKSKRLADINLFIGWESTKSKLGLYIGHQLYIKTLLANHKLEHINPTATPFR